MDFQFSTFDTRKYGYIRGISVLNNLILGKGGEKKDLKLGDWSVNDIQVISGHIAIKYQSSKSIVIFDAAISKFQMGEAMTQNLETTLFSKQFLPLASIASSKLPVLACSFNTTVIKFGFEKYVSGSNTSSNSSSSSSSSSSIIGKLTSNNNLKTSGISNDINPLRFYVFEADGMFHLWEWSTIDYKWRYIVKVYLPFHRIHMVMPSQIDAFHPGQPIVIQQQLSVKVSAVFGSSQGLQVTWLLDETVYSRVFNFDQSSKKKDQIHNQQIPVKDSQTLRFLEEMFPLNLNISASETFEMKKEWLEHINHPSTEILSTKLGIWFITKSFILHWSQRYRIWNITYFKDKSSLLSTNLNQLSLSNNNCIIHNPITLNNNNNINGSETETNEHSKEIIEQDDKRKASIENIIYKVICYCRNPISQELLVLEPSGRLFSLEPSIEKDKLKLHLISVLNPPLEFLSTANNINTIKMVIHQNALVILNQSTSYFYDLKCGKLLSKISLPIELNKPTIPQGIWENGTAGIVWGCGIWSRNEGIWEIRSVPPAQLIQNLSTHKNVYSSTNTTSSSSNNNQGTIGCAPLACRQLDMKRLEAKYLLDMALNEQNEELKIQICKSLLPRLENPSLIIAILSNLQSEQSSKFILEELTNFLEQYDYYQENQYQILNSSVNNNNNSHSPNLLSTSSSSNINSLKQTGSYFMNEDEKIQIDKIRNSFLFHTPFNQKMTPLLKEYYTLQKEALEDSPPNHEPINVSDDFTEFLTGVPNEYLLHFQYGFIEILSKKNPKLLLEKLELALGLNLIDYSKYSDLSIPELLPNINPLLLHPEEIVHVKQQQQQPILTIDESIKKQKQQQQQDELQHQLLQQQQQQSSSSSLQEFTSFPLFETLCQLYYSEKPMDLIPFVRIIHNTAMMKSIENTLSNTNVQNGTIILEVIDKDHFLRCLLAIPIQLPDSNQEDQIDARYKLLCAIGHKPNALRFLLNTDKWEKSIEMVKLTPYHDKEIFVLYEIILTYCVEKKDNIKLKQCWDIIPKNFSIFNLLSLLKPNQSNNSNNINLANSNSSTNNNNNNSGNWRSPSSSFTSPPSLFTSPSSLINSMSSIPFKLSKSTSPSSSFTNSSISLNNNIIYNPQILSTNPSEELTIDMFRGQLLKMLATINK